MLSTVQATMQATMQVTMQATGLAPRKLPRMHPASTTPQAESVEGQVLALCQPFTSPNQTTSIAQVEYVGGEQ